jgi:hypothetical protein
MGISGQATIALLLFLGAALPLTIHPAEAADDRKLVTSLDTNEWSSSQFVNPKDQPPKEISNLQKRLQGKWELLWATLRIKARPKEQFKLIPEQAFDRLVLQEGVPEFNVAVFIRREGPKALALGFGPVSLSQSRVLGGSTGESVADWSSLKLIKGQDTQIPASFKYRPAFIKSPYVVVCAAGCTDQDLSQIEDATGPAAPETPQVAAEKPAVAPTQPAQPAQPKDAVVLWILDQNGQPSSTQFSASIASSCADRRKRGAEVRVSGLSTILKLPEGHAGPTACIVIRAFGEFCWAVRIAPLVQIPASVLRSGMPELACPPDNESVDVVFKVVPAKQAVEKPSAKLREIAKEVELRDVRMIGGAVSLSSRPLSAPSANLPIGALGDLKNLRDEDAKLQLPLTFAAPGRYEYIRPYITQGNSGSRRVELLLVERFSRLADFEFKPVNSNNVFEENCIPQLVVPVQSRLNADAWASAQKNFRDAFEGAGVKMDISPSPARYHFRESLPDLPLATGDDDKTNLTIKFASNDKNCTDYGTDLAVPRTAFLGVPFAPKVHKSRPYFFSIATRSKLSATEVGLTPQLETNFWLAALDTISYLERGTGPSQNGRPRYEQSAFAFWLSSQVQNWPSGADLLLPDANAVRDLTSKFITLTRSQDPGQPLFDYRTQLKDAFARMAGTNVPSETVSPNARILLLGPRLASSESVCVALQDPKYDWIASWLKGGDGRLVFIEMYDSRSQLQMPISSFVARSSPTYLKECRVPAAWQDVARIFMVATDGLIGDDRSAETFGAIKKETESFFQPGKDK